MERHSNTSPRRTLGDESELDVSGSLRPFLRLSIASLAVSLVLLLSTCSVVPNPAGEAGDPSSPVTLLDNELDSPYDDAERRVDVALRIVAFRTSPDHVSPEDIGAAASDLLHMDVTVRARVHDPAITEALLDERGSLFVDGSGLSGSGEALVSALDGSVSHGVDVGDGEWKSIGRATTETNPELVEDGLSTSPDTRRRLVEFARTDPGAISAQSLAERIIADPEGLNVPELRATVEERLGQRRNRTAKLANQEVTLMDAAVRYAFAMAGRRSSPNRGNSLIALIKELRDDRSDALAAQRRLEALSPDARGYDDLRRAYLVEAAAARPWSPVENLDTFIDGSDAQAVAALRQRLIAEEVGGGRAVDTAVRSPDRPSLPGVDSAPVVLPFERRLAQIRLNLERWRQLPIDGQQTFVLVNTAAGEGYLVRNGERILAFDVVRGTYGDPMPVFSSYVDSVTISPTGAVRFRIADQHRLEVCGVLGEAGDEACDRALRQSIRVNKPVALANRLMQITGRNDLDISELGRNPYRTIRLDVNPAIPVHVVYLTATTNTRGDVVFHDDIDARDLADLDRPRLITRRDR